MAFGTGHHETTYQMAEVMLGLDFKNKSVLDIYLPGNIYRLETTFPYFIPIFIRD